MGRHAAKVDMPASATDQIEFSIPKSENGVNPRYFISNNVLTTIMCKGDVFLVI